MKRENALLFGLGMGAGLMYLLDPNNGRRRRATVRDRAIHVARKLDDAFGQFARDAQNRARGAAAELKSRFQQSDDVDDDVLVERIRARMGRIVSHPSAIDVRADNGRVELSGPILEHELDRLLRQVRAVSGVHDVESRLEAHASAADVPGLQGGASPERTRSTLLQAHWSPTAQFSGAFAGAALAIFGAQRRDALGALLGLGGALLSARALANRPFEELLGFDIERGAG